MKRVKAKRRTKYDGDSVTRKLAFAAGREEGIRVGREEALVQVHDLQEEILRLRKELAYVRSYTPEYTSAIGDKEPRLTMDDMEKVLGELQRDMRLDPKFITTHSMPMLGTDFANTARLPMHDNFRRLLRTLNFGNKGNT